MYGLSTIYTSREIGDKLSVSARKSPLFRGNPFFVIGVSLFVYKKIKLIPLSFSANGAQKNSKKINWCKSHLFHVNNRMSSWLFFWWKKILLIISLLHITYKKYGKKSSMITNHIDTHLSSIISTHILNNKRIRQYNNHW